MIGRERQRREGKGRKGWDGCKASSDQEEQEDPDV